METDAFRIRGHVADFDGIVSDIVARSAATRATVRMLADIAYGDAPSETVDLFFPAETATPCPVHMFIHGGYWRAFSKSDYSLVADTVVAVGAIAVIVDYALMPAVRMATLVDQVGRAKQWVLDNIAQHGGDPARLTISGHSAGAHLATMLFQHERTPSRVQSALLLGGLYDLKPLQKSFLKDEIALTDDEVAAFTPMKKQYDASTSVMVLVGARETPPFHQQANNFASKLHGQGMKVSQRVVVNRNHMDSVRDLGVPHSLTGRYLTELIVSAR
ncbi:alpha/beta hydrolase [Devosia sp.]|uniref:alpha/beta hydrolase n=1 Tax=Devosia sp. TaxID=1871048 RepID=UPI002FCA95E5